ncbi:ribonuclease P protein subunit p29 isoform X1 [Molossus molossus]|uniref:ribonuclease P protein subunit p29 isoform X1 n=1 Tax=Molossus molossus TaxID=27622 RepID=UPI001746BC85|nr:ribonuclease P protein subunit p29 isoform X1 [Molossus molossus]
METSSGRTGSGPRTKSVIYHALSQKEAKELDVQHPGAQRAEAFVRAFLKRSTPRMSPRAREDQLQRKAVVLEYFPRRRQKEKKKSRGLSARQRRELKLFDIKPEQQRYELFIPLHELWKQYIRDLCNGLKPDTHEVQMPLLRGHHRDPSSGNKARFQNHHQRRPPESDPQAELRVLCGNRRLRVLHSREQVPAPGKRAVGEEVQGQGNHRPVSTGRRGRRRRKQAPGHQVSVEHGPLVQGPPQAGTVSKQLLTWEETPGCVEPGAGSREQSRA